ncbi:ComEC/Rec2 family competence protein [Flavobacterium filum]|uniref:ComEC/Rec2 family competence protein n=1 Tax=Flavobacterium TaxID=237 RepID=UPI00047B1031|nr:ComEC/Rec2 family competence protein [Flavobacterium filum]
MKVVKFPALNIAICVVLGILFSNEFRPGIAYSCLLLSVSFLPFFIFYLLTNRQKKYQFPFQLATLFLSLCIGIATYSFHFQPNHSSHYTSIKKNEKQLVEGIIIEKLRSNPYSFKYYLSVNFVDSIPKKGKLLIIQSKKEERPALQVGDKVLAYCPIKPIIRPHNPNQFDYANYLEKKDVFDQLYLENNNYRLLGKEQNRLVFLENIRNRITYFFTELSIDPEIVNIIKALFLGQRQDIDQETLNRYSQSGAIHILAISGLHIGILLFFFKGLLKPLERIKNGKKIVPFLLILILWGFAMLSGLSASVVRAVTMFSFVAIGLYMKRETNIYNTLWSSILILVLINPNFIFDVGFLLSYSAVFSIVSLQPHLSKVWQPKNKIISYFYDIITVSVAAQVGVLPLSLYYFHQFPGLFFITNLVIIPLLTAILVVGLTAIILSLLGLKISFLFLTLAELIRFMNAFIEKIASFEQFIITSIPFNSLLLFSSLLVVWSIILWFKDSSYKRLLFVIASLFILQISCIGSIEWNKNKNEFIVFQYPKKSILAKKIDGEIFLISNDSTPKTNYVIKNYIESNFGKIKTIQPLKNLISFDHKRMLVIDEKGIYQLPDNTKVDIVLLTQSPKVNLERLIKELNPKLIIADGSNYKNITSSWEQTCLKQKIPFHSTSEKGYYKFKLP